MTFQNTVKTVLYSILICILISGCKSTVDKYAISTCKAVETNILIFVLDDPTRLVDYLETKNIYCSAVSQNQIRFVTHFQFDDEMLEKLKEALIAYS